MRDAKVEISADELLCRMRSGAAPFILDVRSEMDYGAWRIEDIDTPETMNIPYIEFIEAPEEMIHRVPKDREVVALCAKGGASEYVSDMLRKEGYRSMNVAGGMKAWGRVYYPVTVYNEGGCEVIQFNRVGKGCLSYIVVSGGEAAVIDPGRHIDQYLSYFHMRGIKLKYVFDTHLHADHISGGASLCEATGAAYHLNADDMAGAKIDYHPLEDGALFWIGKSALAVKSISAPGHTLGSTCLLLDHTVLFTGDTLFVSSLGRPDLDGKAAEWVVYLYQTIRGFARFPDESLILPSHTAGPAEYDANGAVAATLGHIRRTNRLMAIEDEREFASEALKRVPEEPEAYQEMRSANLGLLAPDEGKMELWELGRNQCAIEAGGEVVAAG